MTYVNKNPLYVFKSSATVPCFPPSIPGQVALGAKGSTLPFPFRILRFSALPLVYEWGWFGCDSDPGHDIFVSQPMPKCSGHTLFVFILSSVTEAQQDFAEGRGLRSWAQNLSLGSSNFNLWKTISSQSPSHLIVLALSSIVLASNPYVNPTEFIKCPTEFLNPWCTSFLPVQWSCQRRKQFYLTTFPLWVHCGS